jgi:hypothetical protein
MAKKNKQTLKYLKKCTDLDPSFKKAANDNPFLNLPILKK